MAADGWEGENGYDELYQQWHDELAARRDVEKGLILPELCGVRIRIRSPEPGDERKLYQWAADTQERWLWREEPGIITFESFSKQLRSAFAANEPHFIVEGLQSGRVIGWVYADQFSPMHRRCHMHVYVIPEARSYGAGAEAAIYFLDYLFGWLDMRKVIAEALVAQHPARKMAEFWGFQVEGMFREERWLGCQPYDVVRLAISRSVWRRRYNEPASMLSYDMPHLRRILQANALFLPSEEGPQRL
ncbi:MAG TPA: GNAT family protein [Ktedonobacterales bacterium]